MFLYVINEIQKVTASGKICWTHHILYTSTIIYYQKHCDADNNHYIAIITCDDDDNIYNFFFV